MSRRVLASAHNDQTTAADVCTRASFDAMVGKVADLQDVRRDLIHALVGSPVYTHQISEVLFTGIKDYLLTENVLAQRVPGLASLIKLGKFAVNKTMQPIEAAVEKAIKAYIESNLGSTIRRSEESINAYFDEARINEIGDALWESVAQQPLSEFSQALDTEDMDEFVAIGLAFWLEFRQSTYFQEIYTELVEAIFDRYADSKLSALAADFGVNAKTITEELTSALAPSVDQALSSGFLEQRIRARLEGFYASPAAAKAIASMGAVGAVKAARPKRKAAPTKPAVGANKVGKVKGSKAV